MKIFFFVKSKVKAFGPKSEKSCLSNDHISFEQGDRHKLVLFYKEILLNQRNLYSIFLFLKQEFLF